MPESLNDTRFNAREAKLLMESLESEDLDRKYPKIYAALDAFSRNGVTFEPNQAGYAESQFAYAGLIDKAEEDLKGNNLPIQLKILKTLLDTPAEKQDAALRRLQRSELGWFDSLRDTKENTLFTQIIDAFQGTPAAVMALGHNEDQSHPFSKDKKKKKRAPKAPHSKRQTTGGSTEKAATTPTEADTTTETPVETTDPKAHYRKILRESREMAEALGESGTSLIKQIDTQENNLKEADFTGDRTPQIVTRIKEDNELIKSIYAEEVKRTTQAIQALHNEANQLDIDIRQSGFAPENLNEYLIQIEKLGNSPNASDQSLIALKETLTQGHELVQSLKDEVNTAKARAKADKVARDMAARILQRGIDDAQIQKRREAYKKIAKQAAEIGVNKRLNSEKQRLGAMLDEVKKIFNAMNPAEIHANVHEHLKSLRNELQEMTDPDSEEGNQLAIKIQNFFESAQGAADIARRAENQSDAAGPYEAESEQEDSNPIAYLNGSTCPKDPLQLICFHESKRLGLQPKDTDEKLKSKKLRSHDVKRLILLALGPIKIDNGAFDKKAVDQACKELDRIIESGRINRFSKGFKKFLKEYKTKLEAAITQNGHNDEASQLIEKVNAVQTKVVRRFKLPSLGWLRRRQDPERPNKH